MSTPPIPAVDYTDKDFASLRRTLLDLAGYRIPEWTDRSAGDLGMLLVDMQAYVADVVLYYLDRTASELYLANAVEPRSVMHLLRLIGYELTPPAAASCELDLVFDPPANGQPPITTTIPHGFSVSTEPDPASGQGPVPFTYLGVERSVDLPGPHVQPRPDGKLVYQRLPMVQCALQPFTVLGSSRHQPGLRLPFPGKPVLAETVRLQVAEGGTFKTWERRRSLLVDDSGTPLKVATAKAEAYALEVDADLTTFAVFGDDEFCRRPPAGSDNIRAIYGIGGGSHGNVAADTVRRIADRGAVRQLLEATNPLPAAGGADVETIEHAKRFGPLAFRSGDRAVTLRDHVTLALQVPGVAKVRAKTISWNRVDIYAAPAGPQWRELGQDLRDDIVAYFEDRRMIGTFVRVHDATPVTVDIAATVYTEAHYEAETIRQRAEAAVRRLLAYDTVDFGRHLYLSKVYEALEAIDGLRATTVTRFRRRTQPAPGQEELAPDGRIELDAFELPVPGEISLTLGFEG